MKQRLPEAGPGVAALPCKMGAVHTHFSDEEAKFNEAQQRRVGNSSASSRCLIFHRLVPTLAALWEGRKATPFADEAQRSPPLRQEPEQDLPDLPHWASNPGLGAAWPQVSVPLRGCRSQRADMHVPRSPPVFQPPSAIKQNEAPSK